MAKRSSDAQKMITQTLQDAKSHVKSQFDAKDHGHIAFTGNERYGEVVLLFCWLRFRLLE